MGHLSAAEEGQRVNFDSGVPAVSMCVGTILGAGLTLVIVGVTTFFLLTHHII